MKKDIKVKVVLSEGYEERFTKACHHHLIIEDIPELNTTRLVKSK